MSIPAPTGLSRGPVHRHHQPSVRTLSPRGCTRCPCRNTEKQTNNRKLGLEALRSATAPTSSGGSDGQIPASFPAESPEGSPSESSLGSGGSVVDVLFFQLKEMKVSQGSSHTGNIRLQMGTNTHHCTHCDHTCNSPPPRPAPPPSVVVSLSLNGHQIPGGPGQGAPGWSWGLEQGAEWGTQKCFLNN